MSDVLKQARRLAKIGFSVIWLRERSKAPISRKWTEKPTATVDDLEDTYEDGYNCGVRLGKPSRIGDYYLTVIDIDVRDSSYAKEAYAQAEKLLRMELSDFPTVISGSGGKSLHLYALTEEPHAGRKIWHSKEKMRGDDGKMHWCAEVEIFGTGKQVVLPPSIHPDTGKPYRWKDPFDERDLPILDEDRLSHLLGDDGDDEGQTEEDREPLGLTFTEAREVLAALQDLAADRDSWRNVGMALKHEFGERDGWRLFDAWSKKAEGYDKEENLAQWKSFKNERRSKVQTMRSLLHIRKEREIIDLLDDDTEELRDLFDDLPEEEDDTKDAETGMPKHLLKIPVSSMTWWSTTTGTHTTIIPRSPCRSRWRSAPWCSGVTGRPIRTTCHHSGSPRL
jgi:hypothetical protein